jgi:hypothetical protein
MYMEVNLSCIWKLVRCVYGGKHFYALKRKKLCIKDNLFMR